MSAFDRLQNYSAKRGLNETSDVFDIKTPKGAFLNRVHQEGYKMYEKVYELKDSLRVEDSNLMSDAEWEAYNESLEVTEERWNSLSDVEKANYNEKVRFTELHNALTCVGNQVINAVAGSGKALKNGTGVLTPTGFKPIETLKVGNLVASDDGNFYSVTGVYPQGFKDAYEVKFSDGNSIICSKDHLWNVQTDSQRTMEVGGSYGYFWETKSLEDIIKTHPLRTKSGKNNCYIPMQDVVKFKSDTELPLHPYILGLLLGNGTLSEGGSISFSSADDSVLSILQDLLTDNFDNIELSYNSGYDYRLVEPGFSSRLQDGTYRRNELKTVLGSLGLLGTHSNTKFIPKDYLFADIDSRFDLLSGLLDTDGYWANSYYEYSTASKQLAEDVTFLCESLGLTVSVHTKNTSYVNKVTGERINCKLCYRLNIKPSAKNPKLHFCDRINAQFRQTQGYCRRQIREIVDLNTQYEMTCISVDSPNNLFLTEHFIPTHNTTALTFKIIYDIVTGESVVMKSINGGTPIRAVDGMWVCTFLKTGAEELESSVINWQRKLGYSITANQISFSTMDAEFKRCLNAMGVATPIGDASKLHSLFCKAVDSCHIERKGYALSKEDYQIISGIVTYYRGRLDQKRYQHPSCKDYDITPTILDLLVKQFAQLREREGIMDFEEIMELLYKYLYVTPNPAVQDFVANRYNYIYVDEFQDTSQMAYAILKFYARGKLWLNRFGGDVKTVSEGGTVPDGLYTATETKGKLVVVGDVSQCIPSDSTVTLDDNTEVYACELKVGDNVKTNWGSDEITHITPMFRNGRIATITTESGLCGRFTLEHKLFIDFSKVMLHEGLNYPDFEADLQLIMCRDRFYVVSPGSVDCFVEEYSSYIDAYTRCRQYMRNHVCDFMEHFVPDNIYDEFIDMITDAFICKSEDDIESLCDIAIEINNLIKKYRVVTVGDITNGTNIYTVSNGVGNWDKVEEVSIDLFTDIVYDISTKNTHTYISDGGFMNHNCIYSFRGSDSSILAKNIDEDFRPSICTLSVNWRCPSNILNPVISSIHRNEDSKNQDIVAAHQGGEFIPYCFTSYKNMIAQLQDDILKDMDDNMSVAILCRTNFDGLIPAFVLEADGRFNFSVSGENMTLNSPLPRKIIGVTSLFTERATTAVKTSLEFFAGRGGSWAVKQLIDTLKTNNKSIWQLPIEDINYSCPSLAPFVKSVKAIFHDENGNRDKSKEVEALRAVYMMMIVDVFGGDSAYCESARAYIETLLYILENKEFKSVYEFLEEIEFLNDKLNGRIRKKKAPIRIATVHEFKGKECDSVYVWNDSDGTFPSSKCDKDNEDQLNEERRVHYIACTRAKKREHIYALSSRMGMFALEMDCKFNNPIKPKVTLPKSAKELENDYTL